MTIKSRELLSASLLLAVSVMFTYACKNTQKESEALPLTVPDSLIIADTTAQANHFAVELGNTDSSAGYDLDEHLFGKFYGNRASFYIIKEPDNTVFGEKVRSMTLFYLDGILFKTKYVLVNNITGKLINNYHHFTIRGFDVYNRRIMDEERVFFRKRKQWFLNEKLNNYDIHWKLGNSEMTMRVNENDPDEPYQYTINNKDYKKILYKIERTE